MSESPRQSDDVQSSVTLSRSRSPREHSDEVHTSGGHEDLSSSEVSSLNEDARNESSREPEVSSKVERGEAPGNIKQPSSPDQATSKYYGTGITMDGFSNR